MFTPPHPYLRDYQPRPPIRPYPLVDPRHPETSPSARSPPNPSHLIPHVRPLGPPPPPPPVPESLSDPRESRLEASSSSSSLESHSRNLHGEPSPKRRNTQSSSFPFPPPVSRTPHQRPLKSSRVTSPVCQGESSSLINSKTPSGSSFKVSPQARKSPKQEESTPKEGAGSYYPHFQKGALVALGSELRKVEDMRSEDFINAADAAEDLTLDPPSVSSIVMASSGDTATITFNFMSRNTEMSVEPSVDHPFFVLNCGWSSCCPQKTFDKYGLSVRQLQVGDLCVSLTKTTTKQKKRRTASKLLKQDLTQRPFRQPIALTKSIDITTASSELSSTMPPPSSTITTSVVSMNSGSSAPYGTSMGAGSSSTLFSPYAESSGVSPYDPSIRKSHVLLLSESSPKSGGVESPHVREDNTSSSSPLLNVELIVNPPMSPINLSRSVASPKMEHLNSQLSSPSSVTRSSPLCSVQSSSSSPTAVQQISPKPGSPKTAASRCLTKQRFSSQSPLSVVHSPKEDNSSGPNTPSPSVPPTSSSPCPSSSSGLKETSSIWRPTAPTSD
ncbi:Ataxin AXH domain, partial [Trinorchestia longiramus]